MTVIIEPAVGAEPNAPTRAPVENAPAARPELLLEYGAHLHSSHAAEQQHTSF
jgi:hypothetical protein